MLPEPDHQDYQTNLGSAHRFIANVYKSILPWMEISIRDSHQRRNCLVQIGFYPPCSVPLHSYGVNVNISQAYAIFTKELKGYFNTIYSIAEKGNQKHPELKVLDEKIKEEAKKWKKSQITSII